MSAAKMALVDGVGDDGLGDAALGGTRWIGLETKVGQSLWPHRTSKDDLTQSARRAQRRRGDS